MNDEYKEKYNQYEKGILTLKRAREKYRNYEKGKKTIIEYNLKWRRENRDKVLKYQRASYKAEKKGKTIKEIVDTSQICTDLCYAVIKTSFIGFHKWDEAIKPVEYLKDVHRHNFNIVCHIQQHHNNRDIEYHMFQTWLNEQLNVLKENINSCEMLAEDIAKLIKIKYPGRWLKIEVYEDNEVGASYEENFTHDLAWLGGIIDGEGCIYITKKYRPAIMISNTNIDIINKCVDIIQKIGIITNKIVEENRKEKKQKTAYSITVGNRQDVYILLSYIIPYLVGKRQQANTLKEYLCNVVYFAEKDNKDEEIYQKLKLLNKKGV